MPATWPTKNPAEEADYGLDWKDELAGDVITASDWISPDGITVGEKSFTDTMSIIWLSGGSAGVKYLFKNRVRTRGGRVAEDSVSIKVI
jgi:Arc/MetJ family transcription regulator